MIFSGVSHIILAQSPYRINYQAVARDTNSGKELSNQSIFVSLKVIEGAPDGEIIYQEDHNSLTTNLFGLFNLSIGGGDPLTGNFDEINWGASSFWLEIDIDAGDGLQTMSSMQLVSVPYAIHAKTVSNADDADANPENELVEYFNFNETSGDLTIVQQGTGLTQNLNALRNDADADPENELIQGFNFDAETGQLTISQQGGALTENLNALIDDADADPENELVTNIEFNSEDKIFSLIQQGSTLALSLSDLIDDADADPQNELVSSIGFNSTSKIFSLVQPGSTLTQNLSDLVDDADADPGNELVTSIGFNTASKIFSLVQPGSTLTQDLSNLINDADFDPENELITNVEFNSANSTFTIAQVDTTFTNDLSDLINDADADSTNELITSFQLSGAFLTVKESENTNTVNLTQLINDDDFETDNELITNFELVQDTIIRINEGGNTSDIDVSSLKLDHTWSQTASNNTIYSNSAKVGIGTDAPNTNLEVNGSLGYKVEIIENTSFNSTYNIAETDNIIVCKITSGIGMGSILLNMPPAVSFPGRTITVRKTGITPIGPNVVVHFGTNQLDYGTTDYFMSSFLAQTATFISMGIDGWTQIYTD